MPTTTKDFHGDGMNGEVDIVSTNRKLLARLYTKLFQKIGERNFARGDSGLIVLHRLRAFALRYPSVFHAAPTLEGALCNLNPLRMRRAGISQGVANGDGSYLAPRFFDDGRYRNVGHGKTLGEFGGCVARLIKTNDGITVDPLSKRLALGSDSNTRINDEFSSRSVVGSRFFCKEAQSLPALVALNKVTGVKRSNFSGHVFNLSTGSEWYYANDYITHNCQVKSYWRDRMENRGLRYSELETLRLVEVWSHTFMATHWLENNLQVFRRYG